MDRLAENASELDGGLSEYQPGDNTDDEDLSWDDAEVHDQDASEGAEDTDEDLSWDDAEVNDQDASGEADDTDEDLSWDDAQVHDGS
jgi:methyl-accepting chemotaxis protein